MNLNSNMRSQKSASHPASDPSIGANRRGLESGGGPLLSRLHRSLLASVSRLGAIGIVGGLLFASSVTAFPPAPHHVLYGMVRNQFGEPLSISPADVYLETPTGVQLHASVVNGLEPGVNYRLEVPMDSGTAADLYKPTALKPFFQFRLRVQIGQTTYLPIEMAGNFSKIGQPGQQTRIDLTLGVDSDGDGLPDAWEQTLISVYGGTLASIRPEDDADGDGISNLDEYLAGTYAFDPTDGFRLVLTSVTDEVSSMEFLAIRGRTYTIQASADLQTWETVSFKIKTGGVAGPIQKNYQAADVRQLLIDVPNQAGAKNRYFKALVR